MESPVGLPNRPGGGTRDIFAVLDKPMGLAARTEAGAVGNPDWEERRSAGAEPFVGAVRDLTEAEAIHARALIDSPALREGQGGSTPGIKKLRAWHHEAARLMASGVRDEEICKVLECRQPTLGALRRSPAFQNILLAYTVGPEEEAMGAAAKIRAVALLALERAEEVLSDRSTPVNLTFLEKTLHGLLDRSGHSPVQKMVSLHGGLTPEAIRDIKEAVGGRATVLTAQTAHVLPTTTDVFEEGDVVPGPAETRTEEPPRLTASAGGSL